MGFKRKKLDKEVKARKKWFRNPSTQPHKNKKDKRRDKFKTRDFLGGIDE